MRNFNEISEYTIKELIDYIINEFHIPLRDDLQKLDNIILLISDIPLLADKISITTEIFKQFKIEFLEHIEKEENVFFPELLKLEKKENFDKIDKNLINDYIDRLNLEHNELKSYLTSGQAVVKDLTNNIELKDYKEISDFINLIEKLIKDAIDSIHIEDNFLYVKVKNLI